MNRMPKIFLMLGLVGITFSAQAASDVAKVNGKAINPALVDLIYKDLVTRGQKVDENTRTLIVNKLIGSEVLLQDAHRQGIDRQPDFLVKKEMMERELLVGAYLESYLVKHPVAEADIRAEYDKYKAQIGTTEYSARHILVNSEEDAKAIIADLGKGNDFAAVAKAKSLDPGTRDRGGELGWFSPVAMVKPFADAVVKLQKGELAKEPIKTQFGWHVLQLNDARDAQPQPYEQMKDPLQKQIQQRNMEKLVTDLKAKAKIVQGASK